jgi:hypothetical protein
MYKKYKVEKFTRFLFGLLSDPIDCGILLSVLPNKCVIITISNDLPGEYEHIQVPVGASPGQNVQDNVFGCGLLIDPDNKATIFFTLNGIFLGEFFLGGNLFALSLPLEKK